MSDEIKRLTEENEAIERRITEKIMKMEELKLMIRHQQDRIIRMKRREEKRRIRNNKFPNNQT